MGGPSGARFRTYERLKRYAEQVKGTLFESPELAKAIEEIYRFPLRQSATDTLNRQLRAGISDDKLAELVMALRDDDRLCLIHEEEQPDEPQIICSLGLAPADNSGKLRLEDDHEHWSRARPTCSPRATCASLFIEELGWDRHITPR